MQCLCSALTPSTCQSSPFISLPLYPCIQPTSGMHMPLCTSIHLHPLIRDWVYVHVTIKKNDEVLPSGNTEIQKVFWYLGMKGCGLSLGRGSGCRERCALSSSEDCSSCKTSLSRSAIKSVGRVASLPSHRLMDLTFRTVFVLVSYL